MPRNPLESFHYTKYLEEHYPGALSEENKKIYAQCIYSNFVKSCRVGDVMGVCMYVRYIPQKVLLEGLLWATKENRVQVCLFLKDRLTSAEDIERCKKVASQYNRMSILDIFQNLQQ